MMQRMYTPRKARKNLTGLKPMTVAPMVTSTPRHRPRTMSVGMRLKGLTSFLEASAVAFLAVCHWAMAAVAASFSGAS